MDITKLSNRYLVRHLDDSDVDVIVELCRQNKLFYKYTEARPTRENILDDMKATPPGIDLSAKYYVGFFDNDDLIAVMDLIDGYPSAKSAYIGFFMMNLKYQGKQIGSSIINETIDYLRSIGKTEVRLAIDKGNPQSLRFWEKNGFRVIEEVDMNGWIKLAARKPLNIFARPFTDEDFEGLYSLLSDPDVMRFLEAPFDEEKTRHFLETQGMISEPRIRAVDIDGTFAGYVIYHPYDENSVEIGWVLQPEVWNRGYATELTKMMLKMAEAEGKAAIIECDPAQEVTKHIAMKCGFTYAGNEEGLELYSKDYRDSGMKIECVWEHNGDDTLLYSSNVPGAYSRGASKEEGLRKMSQEIISFGRWSGDYFSAPFDISIVQEKESDLAIKDADSDVLFDSEKRALDREEYDKLKQLVLKSARDFYALYEAFPDKTKMTLPSRQTFYGKVPQSAEEMYQHTKNVNTYYWGEIGIEADNDGTILECRARGFEALEQTPEFLLAKIFDGSYGEQWSLPKVLRRFLWHDRIHAKAMYRMGIKVFGKNLIPNVFMFDL